MHTATRLKRKRASEPLCAHFTVVPERALAAANSNTMRLERGGVRFFGKVVAPHELPEQFDLLLAIWRALEGKPEQRLFPRPEGVFLLGGSEVVVTELVPGCDLFEYIANKENAATRTDAVLRAVFVGMMLALRAMHACGFVHGDIKPENVMVDIVGEEVRRVCLVDFGFCFRLDEPPSRACMGTVLYTAPEMLLRCKRRFTTALDAWAVGATILTVYTRESPFLCRPYDEATCMRRVIAFDEGKLRLATASCAPVLARLIAELMAPVETRASLAAALGNEWLCVTPAPASAPRTWRRPLGTLGTSGSAAATS
jgi:serine/threonine protein kinase